jgi:exopolyphosphatase/pppGpp-phosphohydrolase
MCRAERLRRAALGLAFALQTAAAVAGDTCRVAFDIGSSGIRAGASNSKAMPQAEIDYLGPLLAGAGLREAVAPTIAALRELPRRAGFDAGCERIGVGFSAWRLALQRDADGLQAALSRIRTESGVAVLVVPQGTEGAYAYVGAKQALGAKFSTSHVLDIGGGSLQIAGESSSFGAPLGQKLWQRLLCGKLRATDATRCALQPLSGAELAAARAIAADSLQGIATALPAGVSMTATSRPVTRGILPALKHLGLARTGAHSLRRADVGAAIERIAPLTVAETAALVARPADYAAYLLSDLLLVEELMRASGVEQLNVAEIGLNNLAGLLGDDRAFAWGQRYDCYLDRLRRNGEQAYASDPATCTDAESGGAR